MIGVKTIIKVVPFTMLAGCFLSYSILDPATYSKAYSYLSQTIGCSVLTNIYFLCVVERKQLCTYSLIATLGLLSLNIFDIVNLIRPFQGVYQLYLIQISGIFLCLTIISFIKWKITRSK